MKGMIFCYRTLDELTKVYSNIKQGIKSDKDMGNLLLRCLRFMTLYNENEVPYPWTLVVVAEKCFDDFDNWIVDNKIDIGDADMYMLHGREWDVAEMKPIKLKLLEGL